MPESTNNAIVVAITENEIERLKNGQMVLDDKQKIAIYKRGTHKVEQSPKGYFLISMSERALERVKDSQTVTYGIRQIGGVNKELFVRKGTISERVGTNKTVKEKLIEDGMSEEDVERYL